MKRQMIALTSLGLGAGIMYLADPQEGRRRRARAGDAVAHASRAVKAAAATGSRDVENRLAGLAARVQARFVEEPPPSDDVLAARVRARLGRLVSHPGAIEVQASAGVITLTGPIFGAEVEQLVAGVQGVAGVTGVENRVEPHARARDVPALQGPGPLVLRARPRWVRWTPTTRLMAGAAALALMALAARHRTVRGTAVGVAGFELLEQAVRGARPAG